MPKTKIPELPAFINNEVNSSDDIRLVLKGEYTDKLTPVEMCVAEAARWAAKGDRAAAEKMLKISYDMAEIEEDDRDIEQMFNFAMASAGREIGTFKG